MLSFFLKKHLLVSVDDRQTVPARNSQRRSEFEIFLPERISSHDKSTHSRNVDPIFVFVIGECCEHAHRLYCLGST